MLAVPGILFAISVGCKILGNIRVILERENKEVKESVYFEIMQIGPEFCLMGVGIVWAASYRTSFSDILPSAMFAIILTVGILLFFCSLAKGLFKNIWARTIIPNFMGALSIGVSFVGIKMLGVV